MSRNFCSLSKKILHSSGTKDPICFWLRLRNKYKKNLNLHCLFPLDFHIYTDQAKFRDIDFENSYFASKIENSSPSTIEVKEHKYIHRFKTLRPLGINVQNSFKLYTPHLFL